MLTANDKFGNRIVADTAKRKNEYTCPVCSRRVCLKQGSVVTHHFAHYPGSECSFGAGESRRHLAIKRHVGGMFEGADFEYEKIMCGGKHIADIVVRNGQQKFVVECQVSKISREEWETRTRDYNAAGYPVWWIWDLKRMCGVETFAELPTTDRIPDEIRFCCQQSYGHIYAIDENLETRACALVRRDWWDSPKTIKQVLSHTIGEWFQELKGPDGIVVITGNEGIWWKPPSWRWLSEAGKVEWIYRHTTREIWAEIIQTETDLPLVIKHPVALIQNAEKRCRRNRRK